MPNATATEYFVSLNGLKFPLAGPVQMFIGSKFPEKRMEGEVTLETHPLLSPVTWQDWRPGIGKDTYDRAQPGRVWWATTSLRHRGHHVLQRRTVQTAAASSIGAVGFIGDIGTVVLASFGTAVHSYNNSTDAWGSSVRTLANAATDSLSAMVNGTYTLVVAQGSDLDWTTDGSSWNRITTDIDYVSFWREFLWGIDATTGITYFTSNLSNGFTAGGTLRLQAEAVTKMFVGPSHAGDVEGLLWAATTRGLYWYDTGNDRWIESGFTAPYHPNNGRGARAWRGSIYYPAGHAVYEYQPATGAYRIVGPDLDDGLPVDRRGAITVMEGTHNDLIVGIDSATGDFTDLDTFLGTEPVTQLQVVFENNAGFPTLLGWAGGDPPMVQGGWEAKFTSGSQGAAVSALHVSNQYSAYRMWWGSGGRIFYQAIPTDIVNPSQITTTQYESSGSVDTPWFVIPGGQVGVAEMCFLETRNPTSSEAVALAYARNHIETFTTLGTNSSAEEKQYNFNDASSNPTGLVFRSIRFRMTLTRGTTNTNSPDVIKLGFAYKPSFAFLKGFRVALDLTRPMKGRSIREMRGDIDTILSTTTQMKFFYQDATESDDIYYVTLAPGDPYQGIDRETGRQERGTHILTLMEAMES